MHYSELSNSNEFNLWTKRKMTQCTSSMLNFNFENFKKIQNTPMKSNFQR